MPNRELSPVVAGIDVGGTRKGFHLVILTGCNVTLSTKSPDPEEILQFCLDYQVELVAVDAPCKWADRNPRHAERTMAKEGIFSFSTPSREKALTSAFYGWMFNGERMFSTLANHYPLLENFDGELRKCTIETFPHAISCAYLGKEIASAKIKGRQRRSLLSALGVDTKSLKSIDALDAALCALTAQSLLHGKYKPYGDIEGGYLVVPLPKSRVILNDIKS